MSAPFEQQPFEPPPFQPPPPPQSPIEPPARRPKQLMIVGIVVAVLGAIVLLGGLFRLIPGGTSIGGSMLFGGLVLKGLSFVPLPRVPESEPPISQMGKVTGMFFEPTTIFRNLRVHPHWLVAFIVVTTLSVIYSFAFVQRVTPERIVNHMADKAAELPPPFTPPPETIEQMRINQAEELKNPIQRVGTVVKAFVVSFLGAAAISALYLVGVLAFGGRINFWQALAVYFHAAIPVTFISKILSLVILYLKVPEDIHPILGQDNLVQDNLGLLFSPSMNPILFVWASWIGVLSFYGLWLKAKGIHYGGTKVSSAAGWGVALTLWILGLIGVTIITALLPGFIG